MKFVTREQWGARRPTSGYTSINSTVTTGHWEGPHMGTFGHDSCAPKVRGIQAYHMDNNGWSDIAYNGVACPHGYVFEGRGPGHRSAANGTNTGNDTSAVICYLGGQGDDFTADGQQAMADGADWLGDPMLKGHRDWYATECPGQVIYDWINSGAQPAPGPGPGPTPPETEDDMPLHIVIATPNNDGGKWWLTDWITKWWLPSADVAAQVIVSTRATGGKIECTNQNGPVEYAADVVNAVPVAE